MLLQFFKAVLAGLPRGRRLDIVGSRVAQEQFHLDITVRVSHRFTAISTKLAET